MSKSNDLFDQALKERNPCWGLRDLEEVNKIAQQNKYKVEAIIKMPANNTSVVYNNYRT